MSNANVYTSFDGKPIYCENCHGHMVYVSSGQYQCEKCKSFAYDDFGKVKLFLEEYGNASAPIIAQATGVKESTVDQLLREGRIQIAANSKVFLKCETCGASIRFGRYCQKCTNEMVGRIESILDADNQTFINPDANKLDGKMRFVTPKQRRATSTFHAKNDDDN